MRGSKKWCRNPDGRYKTAFGRRDRIRNLAKCWIIWILTVGMMFSFPLRLSAANENLTISAPSAILIEKTTGSVLYEKEADTRRAPASVTKVMTMLLIMDGIAEGKIHKDDQVTVSEYAASMGGSQVFLEPGETQTVDTMLKCIAVASANDACVAMAEHLCGSEEVFVEKMNEKAKELGMTNSHFVNCNGLDAEGHETTARDISLMSKELITKYPEIQDYSMIWMENITHHTRKGDSEFGLTNTNKLVRQYEYATGLKTGSTGNAKFCVSATAKKDDVELIAVIMGAENSKERFKDAVTLLGYGFGICRLYRDDKMPELKPIEVENGTEETAEIQYAHPFTWLDTTGAKFGEIEKKLNLPQKIQAPGKKGETIGTLDYYLGKEKIGSVEICLKETIEKASLKDWIQKMLSRYCHGVVEISGYIV